MVEELIQKASFTIKPKIGISEIKIFSNGSTFDYLNILSTNCSIEISNDIDTCSILLGTIKYSSENSYYVDQSYILEAGAFILSQGGGNILNGKKVVSLNGIITFYHNYKIFLNISN